MGAYHSQGIFLLYILVRFNHNNKHNVWRQKYPLLMNKGHCCWNRVFVWNTSFSHVSVHDSELNQSYSVSKQTRCRRKDWFRINWNVIQRLHIRETCKNNTTEEAHRHMEYFLLKISAVPITCNQTLVSKEVKQKDK